MSDGMYRGKQRGERAEHIAGKLFTLAVTVAVTLPILAVCAAVAVRLFRAVTGW